MLRSKAATIGRGCYLLFSVIAIVCPWFSKYEFPGFWAFIITLPWSNYLATAAGWGWLGVLLAGCAILNASITLGRPLHSLSRALAAATVPQESQTDMLSLCSSIVLHDDRDEVMPEQAKLAERYQSGNPAQLTFPVFAKGILLPSNLMH
jgi:hypothetical protein